MGAEPAANHAPPHADVLSETPCPSCGSERYTVLLPARYPSGLTVDDLLAAYRASSDQQLLDQLVRCDGCDLVYLNPRIRDDLVLQGYADAQDPTFAAQNPERIATFARSLRWVLRAAGWRAGPHVRVLDVGCAGGAFPKAAADAGLSVVGVEPSRWLAEHARATYGLDIRTGVLEAQDFAPASFDLVTLWDVIEHLTDPGAAVDRIGGLLRDDGLLVVNFPDQGSAIARAMGSRWPFRLSVHLIYFTRRTMAEFLRRHGYELVAVRPYFQTLGLGYVLRRGGAYLPGLGTLGRAADRLGLGRVPVRYTLGQTLVVARKAGPR